MFEQCAAVDVRPRPGDRDHAIEAEAEDALLDFHERPAGADEQQMPVALGLPARVDGRLRHMMVLVGQRAIDIDEHELAAGGRMLTGYARFGRHLLVVR